MEEYVMTLVITKENFNDLVLNANKPVLVDFYADWCGPCKMQLPVVDEVAKTLGDTAVVGKINVDEQGELAQMFGVRSIPTLITFEKGKVKESGVGFHSKEALIKMLGL